MLPPDATETYGAPLTTVTTKVARTAEVFNGGDHIPPPDGALRHPRRSRAVAI
jgi:hypothetical protein